MHSAVDVVAIVLSPQDDLVSVVVAAIPVVVRIIVVNSRPANFHDLCGKFVGRIVEIGVVIAEQTAIVESIVAAAFDLTVVVAGAVAVGVVVDADAVAAAVEVVVAAVVRW